jgi:WD40 repeat protein
MTLPRVRFTMRRLMIALAAITATPGGLTGTGGKAEVPKPVQRPIIIWPPSLNGKRGAIQAFAFTPDGKALAVANAEGLVRFYDPATARERAPALDLKTKLGDAVEALAYSPDGRTLAVGLYTEGARLLDVATRATRRTLLVPPPGRPRGPRGLQSLTALAFSPDGKALAGATSDGQVAVWDVATGNVQRLMVGPIIPPVRPTPGVNLPGRPAWVTGLAYAPDGRSLVTTGHERVVRVWDPDTGRERFTAPGSYPAYSPDGTTVAVGAYGGLGGSIALLDPSSGRVRSVFEGSKSGPVAFLPGGNTLVCFGAKEQALQLWDAATGRLRDALPLGQQVSSANQFVAVSPDGRTVALAGEAGYGMLGWVGLFEVDGTHLRPWTPRP